MSLENKVLNIVSNVIKRPVSELSLDSALNNPSQWDSVAHTNIVLELEDAFDVGFDFDELDKIISVKAILASLRNKGVDA